MNKMETLASCDFYFPREERHNEHVHKKGTLCRVLGVRRNEKENKRKHSFCAWGPLVGVGPRLIRRLLRGGTYVNL